MNFGSVLRELASGYSTNDAARVPALSGYIKRVTLIVPETTTTNPTGTPAESYYDTPVDGVYTRKASFEYTYTAPSGRAVEGPGHIMDPTTSITSTLVTGAEYPFFLVFVSGDGSEFLLNMSTLDSPDSDFTINGETSTGERSIPFVPVDRTLLMALASDDWTMGSTEDFEAIRTSAKIW